MNNQKPASPSRWVDQWGAIVTDDSKGIVGSSANMLSQDQAKQTALADCQTKGGTQCKLEITYYNQCAAMIVGDKKHNSGSAATLDKAVQLGIKVCKDSGDTNCKAYYTACSLPKRIQ